MVRQAQERALPDRRCHLLSPSRSQTAPAESGGAGVRYRKGQDRQTDRHRAVPTATEAEIPMPSPFLKEEEKEPSLAESGESPLPRLFPPEPTPKPACPSLYGRGGTGRSPGVSTAAGISRYRRPVGLSPALGTAAPGRVRQRPSPCPGRGAPRAQRCRCCCAPSAAEERRRRNLALQHHLAVGNSSGRASSAPGELALPRGS